MASLIRYFFAPSLEGGHFARKAAAFFDDARRHLDSSARRRHSSAQLINFSAYRGDDLLFLSTPSSRPPKHRLDMAPKPKMGNTSVVHVIYTSSAVLMSLVVEATHASSVNHHPPHRACKPRSVSSAQRSALQLHRGAARFDLLKTVLFRGGWAGPLHVLPTDDGLLDSVVGTRTRLACGVAYARWAPDTTPHHKERAALEERRLIAPRALAGLSPNKCVPPEFSPRKTCVGLGKVVPKTHREFSVGREP